MNANQFYAKLLEICPYLEEYDDLGFKTLELVSVNQPLEEIRGYRKVQSDTYGPDELNSRIIADFLSKNPKLRKKFGRIYTSYGLRLNEISKSVTLGVMSESSAVYFIEMIYEHAKNFLHSWEENLKKTYEGCAVFEAMYEVLYDFKFSTIHYVQELDQYSESIQNHLIDIALNKDSFLKEVNIFLEHRNIR